MWRYDVYLEGNLRLLESKASASEFTMAIGEKAVCVRKKTAKLVTMMERLVTKQTSCNKAFIGDMMTSVALNEQETQDLLEWGRQAGLSNIQEEGSK